MRTAALDAQVAHQDLIKTFKGSGATKAQKRKAGINVYTMPSVKGSTQRLSAQLDSVQDGKVEEQSGVIEYVAKKREFEETEKALCDALNNEV